MCLNPSLGKLCYHWQRLEAAVIKTAYTRGIQNTALGSDAAREALQPGPRKQSSTPTWCFKLKHYEVTKFQITRDVEMPKFFEELPESASPLPWSAGVLWKIR
jgi:GH25 family lysozyme M1 (1,4-beta-N-acetylmuramidase)